MRRKEGWKEAVNERRTEKEKSVEEEGGGREGRVEEGRDVN